MKHRARILALAAAVAGIITLGNLQAQAQPDANLPPGLKQRSEIIRNERSSVPGQISRLDTKVNQLLQSRGGRFVFIISNGELIRLDSQTGKVAFFNIVSGATWYTLDIPELTLRPGNAFFEQYVQMLDKLDFNTN